MDYDGYSDHITTMGKIIFNTLMDERNGKQLGKTIENYHIENLLLNYIFQERSPKNTINIIEVGGVIGHDNQDIILKTISKIEKKMVIVLSYGLWLNNLQEYKSLPIIFGLDTLKKYGIKSDFLCIRSEKEMNEYWMNYFKKKIRNYFKFHDDNLFFLPDLSSSYGIYSYLLNKNLPTTENIVYFLKNNFNNIGENNWEKVHQDQSIMD